MKFLELNLFLQAFFKLYRHASQQSNSKQQKVVSHKTLLKKKLFFYWDELEEEDKVSKRKNSNDSFDRHDEKHARNVWLINYQQEENMFKAFDFFGLFH